jgi:two-component system, NarL family, response regulator DevR
MNRILLVEDHNVVRDALASALNREPDLEVGAQTRSLAEARIAVALGGIDAAIIDLDLPDGDGLELVQELRDGQPRSIPVLVLTKNLDPAVHDLALKAGASEVITTLVSIEEIRWTLRRIAQY